MHAVLLALTAHSHVMALPTLTARLYVVLLTLTAHWHVVILPNFKAHSHVKVVRVVNALPQILRVRILIACRKIFIMVSVKHVL